MPVSAAGPSANPVECSKKEGRLPRNAFVIHASLVNDAACDAIPVTSAIPLPVVETKVSPFLCNQVKTVSEFDLVFAQKVARRLPFSQLLSTEVRETSPLHGTEHVYGSRHSSLLGGSLGGLHKLTSTRSIKAANTTFWISNRLLFHD